MVDIKNYIGLCRAARGIVCGANGVLTAVRGRKIRCVLIAADASQRTHKQIHDKCAFYQIACADSSFSASDMGQLVGLRGDCAVIGFTGRGPADAVMRLLFPGEKAAGGGNSMDTAAKSEEKDYNEKNETEQQLQAKKRH